MVSPDLHRGNFRGKEGDFQVVIKLSAKLRSHYCSLQEQPRVVPRTAAAALPSWEHREGPQHPS